MKLNNQKMERYETLCPKCNKMINTKNFKLHDLQCIIVPKNNNNNNYRNKLITDSNRNLRRYNQTRNIENRNNNIENNELSDLFYCDYCDNYLPQNDKSSHLLAHEMEKDLAKFKESEISRNQQIPNNSNINHFSSIPNNNNSSIENRNNNPFLIENDTNHSSIVNESENSILANRINHSSIANRINQSSFANSTNLSSIGNRTNLFSIANRANQSSNANENANRQNINIEENYIPRVNNISNNNIQQRQRERENQNYPTFFINDDQIIPIYRYISSRNHRRVQGNSENSNVEILPRLIRYNNRITFVREDSTKLLDQLPQFTYNKENKIPDDNIECSICIMMFNYEEQVTILPCAHFFHSNCLKSWFNKKDTCPICLMKANKIDV